jgi:ketosteroid isomerase-like protein
MTSSKLEAIKRLFELFNRLPADPELRAESPEIHEMLDLFDPEAEWVPPPTAPGMTRSHGREELRKFWLDWLSDWQEHRFDADEITERDDRVLALLRNRLRGRDGIEFEASVGVIFDFRGEKILRGAVYLDEEGAREEFEAGA